MVFKERGWKDFGEKENSVRDEVSVRATQCWNLWWRSSIMNSNRARHLKQWQITNHILKASNLARKDVLARHLRRLKSTYGAIYDFSPLSFNLPLEYTRLVAEHTKRLCDIEYGAPPDSACIPFGPNHHLPKGKKAPLWISKPIAKSQGKGILLFDQVTKFSYDEACVVQEYIARPYLINGYKWDLRLYVCITSTSPLTFYAYREGITRFATSKYDLSNLPNTFSHLTNTSVNKQGPNYRKNKETIGFGSKWTLRQLRRYFDKTGVDDYYLWQRIWSILVLTIIGDGRNLARIEAAEKSFELLGFDILVDENLKPNLLEVNTNPGLACDDFSNVDEQVKKPMLHQMFTLLGLPDCRDFMKRRSSAVSVVPPPPPPPQASSAELEKACWGESEDEYLLEQIVNSGREWESSLSPSTLKLPAMIQSWVQTPFPQFEPSKMMVKGSRVGSYKNGRKRLGHHHHHSHHHLHSHSHCCCQVYDGDVEQETSSSDDETLHFYEGTSQAQSQRSPEKESKFTSVGVNLPVLKGPREKLKAKLPKNGPGLWFSPRDWSNDAPSVCGDWVRVFPFDAISDECAKFETDEDMKKSVTQVSEYLKYVKDILRHSGYRMEDSVYDECIRDSGAICTEVWHPYL
ncbi:unnamed protein product [Orchesella dallaii]|uniref:Tubulin polyglutamylase TTLL2 n=1 Tax=Orchesella dallaii TaxID=48710 RepID=A0ABP1R9F9_9HEXA